MCITPTAKTDDENERKIKNRLLDTSKTGFFHQIHMHSYTLTTEQKILFDFYYSIARCNGTRKHQIQTVLRVYVADSILHFRIQFQIKTIIPPHALRGTHSEIDAFAGASVIHECFGLYV